MLVFFPYPYEDELLYSVFARYHERSHNSRFDYTSMDLFGRTTHAMPGLPSGLRALCGRLPKESLFKADRVICDNTLFPLYRPFLPENRMKVLLDLMKKLSGGAMLIKVAGILQSNIKPPRFLRYCPQCVKSDEEKNGEAYWHRSHQIVGVRICHIHDVWLRESSVAVLEQRDRRAYYVLESNELHLEETLFEEKSAVEHYKGIAKDVHWILNNDIPTIGLEKLHERYICLLEGMGLTTFGGDVRRQHLIKRVIGFYGEDFLSDLGSPIDPDKKDNWVTDFLRKSEKAIHPIRHVLFMRFLGIKPEEFWQFQIDLSLKKWTRS